MWRALQSFFPVFFVALLASLVGCVSHRPIDTSTTQGAFQQAEFLHEQGRHEEALAYLRDIKTKHPYSRWATEADLRIADIHFYKKSWVEAESAYRLFKEFHPQHKKIDYVTFRMAMSLFKQLPESIDRDIHLADRAISYFDEVVRAYPKSDYYQSAKEHKVFLRKIMAKKQMYIANFYFVRDMFDSAHKRYVHVLEKYSGLGYNLKALYRAAISSYKNKDLHQARIYLTKLAREFPKSNELAKAKEIIKYDKQ